MLRALPVLQTRLGRDGATSRPTVNGCKRKRVLLLLPQPITKGEFATIFGPAAMHAVGHIAANLSFAAVAISLTHTVKTLEPVF